jgi:hypothetical protein
MILNIHAEPISSEEGSRLGVGFLCAPVRRHARWQDSALRAHKGSLSLPRDFFLLLVLH